MEVRGHFEAGTWNYSIHVPSEDTDKTAIIVVHLNVGKNVVVQGFLDDHATSGSVIGNQTKVVTAYAFLRHTGCSQKKQTIRKIRKIGQNLIKPKFFIGHKLAYFSRFS